MWERWRRKRASQMRAVTHMTRKKTGSKVPRKAERPEKIRTQSVQVETGGSS